MYLLTVDMQASAAPLAPLMMPAPVHIYFCVCARAIAFIQSRHNSIICWQDTCMHV